MPPTTALGPGARLRVAREAAALSRRELAERLGWATQSLANFEADQDRVSLDKIHEVALAIGCDPHAIDPRLASTKPRKRQVAD
jgi:transcriptional regulator with XRE-family HTH domain